MASDQPLSKLVHDLVEKLKEPLGLDRWQIKIEFGPGDNTAACAAMPEYQMATIAVDPDKLETGDELDEIVCHEMGHPGLWPIASVAEDMALALAESAPEHMVAPLAKLFKETVRKAEEYSATTVGRNYTRIMRRLWAAEADLAAARAELKALKKASRETGLSHSGVS